MVQWDSCKGWYHLCQRILSGVICPVTNGSAQCKSKKRAIKRLQIAQRPTREAKLVILPYKALKKTEIEERKYPKLMLQKTEKKYEKIKTEDIAKEFFKKQPYITLKIELFRVR